ncbi:glycosyltransferase family 4 protein [Persicitalea jodogahamensis]|uniref:Glycosyl transferase family 1 domain-containing protein n=1 Tax=Persicitalea jodogahamensis TaxID=402147 RepID=A0A8J3G885_9BACT|nr:glycosyltransferase family 1 protein [Persicitalea jodogahamensis]GHB62989.1 hypothetical protein GCM10007390_16030 [Persicitalea jodogahamensis]
MNIIFFAHPPFLSSQSMPRYANWLYNGMLSRGHSVKVWTAYPRFYSLPVPLSLKKWMGYIDQYIIFPIEVRLRLVELRLNNNQKDILFVFTDNALGPWVPLTKKFHHIIHCHDFLAQFSAAGMILENPTSFSGKIYQRYIKMGLRNGKNFICISKKTRSDLYRILDFKPSISDIVYNGLVGHFSPTDSLFARKKISSILNLDLSNGFILHVGGNQWYKNRIGVVELYDAWRHLSCFKLPLLMVGPNPSKSLLNAKENSKFQSDIYFLTNRSDNFVLLSYQSAALLLFPSLAEGFGWPIVEAMACGIPVITTNEAPMTEVAGDAAFYINRRPFEDDKLSDWTLQGAHVIDRLLSLNQSQRKFLIASGLENAKRFECESSLDKIENIYRSVTN